MDFDKYPGPERRRFRRLPLHYPVSLRTLAATAERVVVEGVTENLSFGGALVGVSGATTFAGATQVELRFVDEQTAVPVALSGVVWCRGAEDRDERVAVEFDVPLLTYEGAAEIADRLDWLRGMGGDDFVRQIVDRFLDSVPAGIRNACDSVDAGDLDAVAQVGRSLKSSAGNIGAVNLYEMARRAEQAARQGDGASAARFVHGLQPYFETVKRELAGFS